MLQGMIKYQYRVRREHDVPSSKESEDVVLALLRQPSFLTNVEINLLEVDAQDFGSEYRHEVLCERAIFLRHRRRQLTGVTEAVEQPAKDSIRPLLGDPPL